MNRLLKLLERNARIPLEQLAAASGLSLEQTAEALERFGADGIIKGYTALVDWDSTSYDCVTARIEVKILLDRTTGFDDVCQKMASFEEVQSVLLMSGSYDIALTVSGKSFKEVAMFVASKLSPLDAVQSTSTSFVLRKYKERGFLYDENTGEREAHI
jgi:DNA-binding Lrp family transcriptional regulator